MRRTTWILGMIAGICACGGNATTGGQGGGTGTGGGAGTSATGGQAGTSTGGTSTGGSSTGGSSTGGTSTGGSSTGGSSTGGTATGGTSTGGTSAGGSTGMGGAKGGSAGSAGSSYTECKEGGDADCKMHSDCCVCMALGPNDPTPPSCLQNCLVDTCTSLGLGGDHKAACQVGQCIVGADCDPSHAMCNAIPPTCPPGNLPIVVNSCWGGCVPVTQCLNVPSCDACNQPELLCVNHNYSNYEYHCVPAPAECQPNLDSNCLCPLVCPNWNFCSKSGSSQVQCDYI